MSLCKFVIIQATVRLLSIKSIICIYYKIYKDDRKKVHINHNEKKLDNELHYQLIFHLSFLISYFKIICSIRMNVSFVFVQHSIGLEGLGAFFTFPFYHSCFWISFKFAFVIFILFSSNIECRHVKIEFVSFWLTH